MKTEMRLKEITITHLPTGRHWKFAIDQDGADIWVVNITDGRLHDGPFTNMWDALRALEGDLRGHPVTIKVTPNMFE
jgi:hypothetical protein